MLMHQTLSKGWCCAKSRLLLGLMYVLIDDGWKLEHGSRLSRRKPERPALLTDSDVLTLVFLSSGRVSQRPRFLALYLHTSAVLFPYALLPEPVQPQGAASGNRDEALQGHLSKKLLKPSTVYHVLDTTLISAMVRVRVCRKGLFAGQATFGRCASKTEWVYGFKVAL